MQENTTPDSTEQEIIQIDDLDQFVRILASWHHQKVQVLAHMLQLPEGAEMSIKGSVDGPVAMSGERLAGFKAGLGLALMELGHLPFLFEEESDEKTPSQDEA